MNGGSDDIDQQVLLDEPLLIFSVRILLPFLRKATKLLRIIAEVVRVWAI